VQPYGPVKGLANAPGDTAAVALEGQAALLDLTFTAVPDRLASIGACVWPASGRAPVGLAHAPMADPRMLRRQRPSCAS
jgi:hypothetical protein